ncbi:HGGxSTG domain-containing protein [Streptomyces sp. NPDC048349]|uniref:HGGxSTG domain-containing protein n=1 Tax=Streptomyces sp. NPDC048349 TaxID=3155486 RepID=UPI00342D1196
MAVAQPRCGARTKVGGRCRRLAVSGTSRCSLHQGPWSAYGAEQEKIRQAKAKMKKLRNR